MLKLQETQVQSLSQQDPLEKGMTTHSSILAWKIPRTEEPGYSPWDHKESDMTEQARTSRLSVRPAKFQIFPDGSDGKESACNAGDLGSIPGSGRSPGEGNGNPLQYSCLENPMYGGAWWATVHGVAKSWT